MPKAPPHTTSVPLFSPSEWLIFRVVRQAGSPITLDDIVDLLPPPGLPSATVAALLDRLAARADLYRIEEGWLARPHDYAALLARQVEHFLAAFVLEDPEGPDILLRVLEERTGKRVRRSERPEVG